MNQFASVIKAAAFAKEIITANDTALAVALVSALRQ
jgi:hypothetical protein